MLRVRLGESFLARHAKPRFIVWSANLPAILNKNHHGEPARRDGFGRSIPSRVLGLCIFVIQPSEGKITSVQQ